MLSRFYHIGYKTINISFVNFTRHYVITYLIFDFFYMIYFVF